MKLGSIILGARGLGLRFWFYRFESVGLEQQIECCRLGTANKGYSKFGYASLVLQLYRYRLQLIYCKMNPS